MGLFLYFLKFIPVFPSLLCVYVNPMMNFRDAEYRHSLRGELIRLIKTKIKVWPTYCLTHCLMWQHVRGKESCVGEYIYFFVKVFERVQISDVKLILSHIDFCVMHCSNKIFTPFILMNVIQFINLVATGVWGHTEILVDFFVVKLQFCALHLYYNRRTTLLIPVYYKLEPI